VLKNAETIAKTRGNPIIKNGDSLSVWDPIGESTFPTERKQGKEKKREKKGETEGGRERGGGRERENFRNGKTVQ